MILLTLYLMCRGCIGSCYCCTLSRIYCFKNLPISKVFWVKRFRHYIWQIYTLIFALDVPWQTRFHLSFAVKSKSIFLVIMDVSTPFNFIFWLDIEKITFLAWVLTVYEAFYWFFIQNFNTLAITKHSMRFYNWVCIVLCRFLYPCNLIGFDYLFYHRRCDKLFLVYVMIELLFFINFIFTWRGNTSFCYCWKMKI